MKTMKVLMLTTLNILTALILLTIPCSIYALISLFKVKQEDIRANYPTYNDKNYSQKIFKEFSS